QPVGDAKNIDAHFKLIRSKCHRCHGHVTAIAAADNADFRAVDVGLSGQPVFAGDAVLEILVPVIAVIHLIEGLAVPAAAAIVDGEDGIPLVDEILDQGEVAGAGLSAGTAVHPYQGRDRIVGGGLV